MPYADTLKVFETLRQEFDEKKAAKIAEAIESALETNNDALLQRMGEVVGTKISEAKAEIIKWMFIFWVGQSASMYALLRLLK